MVRSLAETPRTLDALHQLIYISCLATDVNPQCISQILRTARNNNSRLGITGLLIFDGLRFCQYLEGPIEPVRELVKRISVDPRHVQFAIKEQGPLIGSRRFPTWNMGYALASRGDGLEGFNNLEERSAIELLAAMLPSLEMDPPQTS